MAYLQVRGQLGQKCASWIEFFYEYVIALDFDVLETSR